MQWLQKGKITIMHVYDIMLGDSTIHKSFSLSLYLTLSLSLFLSLYIYLYIYLTILNKSWKQHTT